MSAQPLNSSKRKCGSIIREQHVMGHLPRP
ncbi:Uncharacterised protein [Vibrio cholerae]|nr:Uncharacterised protein [Vibrio cholerae]